MHSPPRCRVTWQKLDASSHSTRCHEADRREENVQPHDPMMTPTNAEKLSERLLGSPCEVVKLGVYVRRSLPVLHCPFGGLGA